MTFARLRSTVYAGSLSTCANRMTRGSSHGSKNAGAGTCRGTATRVPVRSSPRGDHPAYVRKGWLAVARISLPDSKVSRKTGRTPVGKTCVIGRRT